jgi:hypothetical protein
MFDETKDRIGKNLSKLKEEWKEFGRDQLSNLKRLTKPSLNPSNREHFVPHVLVAVISTTYGLRRTLTYLTVAAIIYYLYRL